MHIYAKLIPASGLCIVNAALPAGRVLPQTSRGCLFTSTQLSARESPPSQELLPPCSVALGKTQAPQGRASLPRPVLPRRQELTHRQKHTKYCAADVTLGVTGAERGGDRHTSGPEAQAFLNPQGAAGAPQSGLQPPWPSPSQHLKAHSVIVARAGLINSAHRPFQSLKGPSKSEVCEAS